MAMKRLRFFRRQQTTAGDRALLQALRAVLGTWTNGTSSIPSAAPTATSQRILDAMNSECYECYIERVEGVQGGEPVVCGTRTPVSTIAILFHVTYPNDIDEVRRALPHLTAEQIDAALAYYQAHRDEIDADIQRHEQALRDFLRQQHASGGAVTLEEDLR
jgi:uncharacterized protein (DUF433 family)